MRALLFGLRGIVGAALIIALGATILFGVMRHSPVAPAVNAADCCWAPKHGRDTRCYPCRPSSPANR
jgi:hypothetical protein